MQEFVELVSRYKVIPVVRLDSLKHASPLFGALQEGGLPIAEVTLRTDCALDAIREAKRCDNFLIGAGTVLNANQCAEALEAGAEFIVSPGFDAGVIQLCQDRNIPCIPGAATATEIQTAFNAGLRTVKFFPAESLGGAKALAALGRSLSPNVIHSHWRNHRHQRHRLFETTLRSGRRRQLVGQT